MEAPVAEPARCKPVGRGGGDGPPERRRGAEPDIVEQDQKDIRCTGRRPERRQGRKRCVGVLGVVGDGPDMREVRNGQDGAWHGIAPLDSRTCVIGHSGVYSSLGSGMVDR